ncbi:hypothetical protein KIPB_014723, partial [Kipferlia bialata]|eukprot:g14723.t1
MSQPQCTLEMALKMHFGHNSFRPHQRGALEALCEGRD